MSLLEVAKVAGVSLSTVSRAINRPESLTTEKLVAVRKAMTEMNYTPLPPSRRRGPKAGSGGRRAAPAPHIALWCVGWEESQARNYYSSQFELFHFAAAELRMELKLLFSGPRQVPAELINGGIDGCIVQGMQPHPEVLARIRDIPHVWLMTRRSESWPGDYVEPDNHANGCMAADWLASKKARRCAIIVSEAGYPAYVQRIKAFLQRAAEHGIPVEEITQHPWQGDDYLSTTPSGEEADVLARRLLGLRRKVDGLYIPGHAICGLLFRGLRQRGVDPAHFHTILGHYNAQAYGSLDPLPAAIDINMRAIIRHGLAQLADRIANPGLPSPVGVRIAPLLRPETV